MPKNLRDTFTLDSTVWGPHYWFFIHTIALTYPVHPNTITKKKYYELIHNLPVFIPNQNISNFITTLLDKYPVTPYLDNKDSFIRWTHFIHNKVNQKLDKPKITLEQFYVQYYEHYKSKNMKLVEYVKLRRHILYILFIISLIAFIIYYIHYK
jgi:CTP synthase (UTP-ammonia lyase)